MGARNAPYSDICVAWYKALVTTHSQIFCAQKSNLLQQRSEINMYNILHYLHDDRNNCNKICFGLTEGVSVDYFR